MKRKILPICIVGMFVLMAITTLPATGMKINISKESMNETSTGGQIASATLYISRFEDQVEKSNGDIIVSGFLSGSYFAHLSVVHNKVWTPYRIEGEWHCKIGCNEIGTGDEYIFFDVTVPIDYGMSIDPPPNINEDSKPINLDPGKYEVYWSIDIVIWVYENDEFIDKIEIHKFETKGQSNFNKNNYNKTGNTVLIESEPRPYFRFELGSEKIPIGGIFIKIICLKTMIFRRYNGLLQYVSSTY